MKKSSAISRKCSEPLRAVFLLVALGACGGNAAPDETGAARAPATAPTAKESTPTEPAAPRYTGPPRAIDPATTGAVRGVVRFAGEARAPKELAIGASTGCPGHDVPKFTESLLVSDGRLANAYVYVRDGLDGWVIPPPASEPVMMDQKECVYTPHVLALQAGRTLHVKNGDPVTHNVNVTAPRNRLSGNRAMGPGGTELSFPFERREHRAQFRCDLHPWMSAYVFVEEHPFFAVSAKDGSFAIEGLPPGEFELEVLHEDEDLGRVRAKVTVTAGGTAEVELVLPGK